MAWKPHTKITWSGVFGDPDNPYEAWAFGLSMAHDDGSPIDIGSGTGAADALGYGETFVSAVCQSNTKLTQCKLANVGADGKYTGAPQIAVRTPSSGTGSAGYPPQITLAVSLWSSPDDFPRVHGRFYVPAPSMPIVGSTGLALASSCGDLMTAAKALIDSLNGDFITSPGHVVVASQKGAGSNAIVAQIKVGQVFDTMRSRRKSMKESYLVTSV